MKGLRGLRMLVKAPGRRERARWREDVAMLCMMDGSFMATWAIYIEHVMVFIWRIACSAMRFCYVLCSVYFCLHAFLLFIPWRVALPHFAFCVFFCRIGSCMEAPMVILRITRHRPQTFQLR